MHEIVESVRKFRKASKSKPTQKLGDTPTRFHIENMPRTKFMIIPCHSSENREYIPFGYVDPKCLASNATLIAMDASLFTFGTLSSKMHMTWTKYVCGRLESKYRYSAGVVYNNFPWPDPTPAQRKRIEEAAQNVLDVRDRYPDQSYADLYDPLTMPKDLLKAHQKLDKEVYKAYRDEAFKNDGERMSFLFEQYRQKIGIE